LISTLRLSLLLFFSTALFAADPPAESTCVTTTEVQTEAVDLKPAIGPTLRGKKTRPVARGDVIVMLPTSLIASATSMAR
jgi:hypothetical protein